MYESQNFQVIIIHTVCTIHAHIRLADLHRTMNVHTKPPSDDEGAWLGAWPSGRMVGKKGDILKLVSQFHLQMKLYMYIVPIHC